MQKVIFGNSILCGPRGTEHRLQWLQVHYVYTLYVQGVDGLYSRELVSSLLDCIECGSYISIGEEKDQL